MRTLFLFFLILSLLGCSLNNHTNEDPVNFIPDDAFIVLRTNNIKGLSSDLKNNNFLEKFKETKVYKQLLESTESLSLLAQDQAVFLAFTADKDSGVTYTFISKYPSQEGVLETPQDLKIDSLNHKNKTYLKISSKSDTLFTAVKDSVFIASPKKEIVLNLLSKQQPDSLFIKLNNTTAHSPLTIFINGKKLPKFLEQYSSELNISKKILPSWVALEAEILPASIKLDGLTIIEDSLTSLSVFKNTIPQENLIDRVVPSNASWFLSISYNDYSIFSENAQAFQPKDSLQTIEGLYESIDEIGLLSLNDKKAVVLNAIDPSMTQDLLMPFQSNLSTFRDVSIKRFQKPELFNYGFAPFINKTQSHFVFQLENFIIFTEDEDTAKNIITHFLNHTTLSNQGYYKSHKEKLSQSSSLLLVSLNNKNKPFLNSLLGLKKGALNFDNHKVSVLQFSSEKNFAHVNGLISQSKAGASRASVSQAFSITLPKAISSDPKFFSNHRSKGKDIVVQDVANTLYLISAHGKILWSKKLDGKILGDIKEVDLFRNGKKQLAFTTPKRFYILDRNGNPVAPFPLKFKDKITQALSVFDYDNNRKYRFIITQNKDVLMYDSKGKTVKGFGFKKALSTITMPPQHLRIGRKDYILIAEEKGKLNILNRLGKNRILIKEKFQFSENAIKRENSNFVFTTKQGKKVTINTKGKVSFKDLQLIDHHSFVRSGTTGVTLNDNLLRINNQLVEMPLGIYSKLTLVLSNKNKYISLTDLEEHKVYVYTSMGELLPNFPVYGTSKAHIGDADKDGHPNLVVKGENNSIILYNINR